MKHRKAMNKALRDIKTLRHQYKSVKEDIEEDFGAGYIDCIDWPIALRRRNDAFEVYEQVRTLLYARDLANPPMIAPTPIFVNMEAGSVNYCGDHPVEQPQLTWYKRLWRWLQT